MASESDHGILDQCANAPSSDETTLEIDQRGRAHGDLPFADAELEALWMLSGICDAEAAVERVKRKVNLRHSDFRVADIAALTVSRVQNLRVNQGRYICEIPSAPPVEKGD